jgi:hypothetical protein
MRAQCNSAAALLLFSNECYGDPLLLSVMWR